MKKNLSVLLFLCLAVYANAQKSLLVTLEAEAGIERSIIFGASAEGTKLEIDWGNGNPVLTDEIAVYDGWTYTTVNGTPLNDGVVKIYGDNIVYIDCSSTVDGSKITSLDVTEALDLQELVISTNSISEIDLSRNSQLTRLVCYSNPLVSLDLSGNPLLENLDAKDISITDIDLSCCPMLKTVYLNNNNITSLDISKNVNLENLYLIGADLSSLDLSNSENLKTLSVNNNSLESLDASSCSKLATLFCIGNNISELIVPETLSSRLSCSGNRLDFASLPECALKNYIYAPQQPVSIPLEVVIGSELDMSYLDNIKGVSGSTQQTTFVWKTAEEGRILTEGEDYEVADGIFRFLTVQDSIYCEMSTLAFPDFSDNNILRTSNLKVVEEVVSIADVEDGKLCAYRDGNYIVIDNIPENKEVCVYSLDGVLIYFEKAVNQRTVIELETDRYLIVIGDEVIKI